MAIVETLTKSAFINSFNRIRPDNFTYRALEALYDFLEELSESNGEPIEFDPIGLCIEYNEYANFEEFKQDYEDWCIDNDIESLEDLQNAHNLIMIDDESFIIEQF